MPTIPRRPAAQRERQRLEARRLRAAELFAAGVRQAEVTRRKACLVFFDESALCLTPNVRRTWAPQGQTRR